MISTSVDGSVGTGTSSYYNIRGIVGSDFVDSINIKLTHLEEKFYKISKPNNGAYISMVLHTSDGNSYSMMSGTINAIS